MFSTSLSPLSLPGLPERTLSRVAPMTETTLCPQGWECEFRESAGLGPPKPVGGTSHLFPTSARAPAGQWWDSGWFTSRRVASRSLSLCTCPPPAPQEAPSWSRSPPTLQHHLTRTDHICNDPDSRQGPGGQAFSMSQRGCNSTRKMHAGSAEPGSWSRTCPPCHSAPATC